MKSDPKGVYESDIDITIANMTRIKKKKKKKKKKKNKKTITKIYL